MATVQAKIHAVIGGRAILTKNYLASDKEKICIVAGGTRTMCDLHTPSFIGDSEPPFVFVPYFDPEHANCKECITKLEKLETQQ